MPGLLGSTLHIVVLWWRPTIGCIAQLNQQGTDPSGLNILACIMTQNAGKEVFSTRFYVKEYITCHRILLFQNNLVTYYPHIKQNCTEHIYILNCVMETGQD